MNTYTRLLQLWVTALGLFLLLALGDPARAQTYVVTISSSTPNLGNVVSSAAAPDTVWRINPSTQAVTLLPGGGAVRLSTNLTRATVTVVCINSGCDKGTVNVQVGTLGTPTNRARPLTNYTVAMGTAILKSGPTGTDPITFAINAIGASGSSKTFYVGADFGIAPDSSGLGTGTSTSGFYVGVAKAPAFNAASGSGTATAVVYRPIAIGSPQSLSFGTIVKPSSGAGTIAVSKVNGSATISGGVLLGFTSQSGGVLYGATTQAQFTVTGEGGRSISLSIPTTFNLTGPSTIAVALDNNATTPTTLGSGLGSAGAYDFSIGGSFSYDSSTPTGQYNGSYNVTASYN